MGLVIGAVLVGLLSIAAGALQLHEIAKARKAYVLRLSTTGEVGRVLEYSAVSDDAIAVHLVTPGVPGFPTLDQYVGLSLSQKSLYSEALRERVAMARFTSGTVSVIGAAVVALTLENFFSSLVRWSGAVATEGWDNSASLWPSTIWFLVLLGAVTVPAIAAMRLRSKARRAMALQRAYGSEPLST